ncbi:unnamed protein product [Hermetia illucens]|uniref:Tyrosine-protein kinase n=2 Tax=Hermetia illucens TaxID=343691 RepID=A0A7R8YX23_HERIL|nr:tyrosine-protein kinase Shark isoform X2 [Hermetia illucens]CAD7088533.1 unnamed protein product [Hermetia illucens]
MSREDNICWFHGKVSRERADEILLEEGRAGKGDGVFLVRESNSSTGDFVLSVLHQGKVHHYQIRRHGEDAFFSIEDQRTIHGLDSLIQHYQESSQGVVPQLSAIVKRDPPPNDSRSHGTTNLLHRSTENSSHTVVAELLKCGYRNFDAKNQDGQTAIHLACLHSDEKMLKLLLTVNVNVNSCDTAGNAPLHYACRKQSGSFIQTLIDAKANIQLRNLQTGRVPLHEAAEHGNLEAVMVLLEHNAPHMPRTKSEEIPIDLAGKHSKVKEYLSNFVPKSPKTTKQLWYHGTLSREEAQAALKRFAETFIPPPNETDSNNGNQQPDENQNVGTDVSGAFLVRFSDRSGYVLTLLHDDVARNFIIRKDAKTGYLCIDEGPYHPSLEHLVQHYMLFQDGLPVNLRYPVPPKPKPKPPTLSTLPKSASKNRSQNGSVLRSINPNETTPPTSHIPQRNLSLPGDDAMNRVGLFENNEDEDKKKIFRSLKLPSPKKKNIIIDGMRSLRKSKNKSPLKSHRKDKTGNSASATTSPESVRPECDNTIAESLIKSLSFSTDFANLSMDGMYNTPTNNCSVVDIDIGEGAPLNSQMANNKEANHQKSDNSVVNSGNLGIEVIGDEKESEYYVKSDKDIATEREAKEKSVFLDPPVTTKPSAESSSIDRLTPPNFTYIPCLDVREFIDQNPSKDSELEESSAMLRQLSQQPERLESMISRMSMSSEIRDIFGRQMSTSSSSEDSPTKMKLNYFIPYDCLIRGDLIGSGEFASVYKGTLIQPSTDTNSEVRYAVAIKMLKDEHCRSNKQEFLREASVIIRLQHHCIVKLIGISNGPSLMMVQELVSLGSMLDYIHKNPDKVNPNCELKIWASQIACGMNYLESQHFVHRDLAARNILLSSRNQAKISDFGLSRALGNDNCYEAKEGGRWPIKWYAPESFNHGLFSHASDVWSFGVTLWEMYTYGLAPYGEYNGTQTIKYIEDGRRLPKPADCPSDIYKVMENCWNYNPRDRPTFRYLTEYFLKDPNYQNLSELIQSEHIS